MAPAANEIMAAPEEMTITGNGVTAAPKTGAPRTSGGPPTAGPRTAGGTLIKTPWRAQQHAEIQALLASIPNNLTCICEICDCGHCDCGPNCRKRQDKSKSAEPFPVTHTQDMFRGSYIPPRSSKKPPPTPREMDIPPMVFDTNQRAEFIPKPTEMRKPVSPPKPNYERPTEPLDGTSYYMQEFLPKKLATPLKPSKRKDKIGSLVNAKFYADTTNMQHYKHWQCAPSKKVDELPCFTGELLYPDSAKFPQSTTQQAYPGVYAPKPEQVKAAPDNLHVGGDGEFLTTTQDVYKGQFGPPANKFIPMPKPFIKKGPFNAQSQTKADYAQKNVDRVRPIDPLQPTIDLKFDNKQSFDTEQRHIYKGHDASKHPVPKSFKKTPKLYERPSIPVEGQTVTHAVFTPKNLADAYIPLRPPPKGQLAKQLPKFDGTTMNKQFFRDWGNRMPRVYKHSDYADVYHPPVGQIETTTTTKETFSTPIGKCFQYLEGILVCIGTMEDILGMSQSDPVSGEVELESHLVERISTEFNQLQFYVSKCKGLPLVEQVKPRINRITQILQQSLEGMFTEGLQSSNEEMLTRCLRTYITIDKVSDAEKLFRLSVVRPYMVDYISDSYIRQKGESFAMYSKILEFKHLKCQLLLSVLKSKSGQEPLKGFDFMVNSIWPDIVELLETKASSVFAPGNPDKFYKEYRDGMEFLTSFESQCSTKQSVQRLRSHPAYDRFISKWSLPVYFQIRFQEIAGSMEKCYLTPWLTCDPPTEYRYAVASSALTCIRTCWVDGVYLHSLTHRFWKLTLQILSRFKSWLRQIADGLVEIEIVVEKAPVRPASRVDLLKADGRSSPASRSESPVSVTEARKPNISELVGVLADSFTLIKQVKTFYETDIKALISPSEQQSDLLSRSLSDSLTSLHGELERIQLLVSEEMTTVTCNHLKQVSDIPRLYRRTNREVPSKPSGYVQQATQSLKTFKEQQASDLPAECVGSILDTIISKLMTQYEETTTDVLVSVKRMEDSLKRLKRGKTTANLVGNMTDDDKIRTQIQLDVQHLSNQVNSLGVDLESMSSYQTLKSEVSQALPQIDSSSPTITNGDKN